MKKEIENNIKKMFYSITPTEDNELFEGIKAINNLIVHTNSLEIYIKNLFEHLTDLEMVEDKNKLNYENLFHFILHNLQEIVEQFEIGSDEDE